MPTVAVGARLGSFVLVDLLGSGGMGEVYRAIDTRLDRTVAVKVLTARVADTARNQRWEREARTVSSLNHPHICTLYDVGDDENVAFLVMEYLEGDTLAERLRRGVPPLDQALQWAIEIAGALDHAHRRGVVHRDLKPANIMLTRSGAKLLDFGVAKLCDSSAESSPSATRAVDTVSEAGAIVGTLHYMAPEQIEARAIDARTDIFAFGALLYEMATGRQAFEGASRAAVMAAIVGSDPAPISTVRSDVPALLERLVERCLMKDPDERWQTAADVKHVLECVVGGVAVPPARSSVGALADRRVRRGRFAWVAACLLFAVLGAVTSTVLSKHVEVDRVPGHFLVPPPEHSTFNPSNAFMAVSPDGRSIAFSASSRDGNTSLWIRPLGSPIARQLPGTDGAFQPFWSPESRSIAFGATDRLKVVDVPTGLVQTVADAPGRHGAWNRDNVMVLQTPGGELLRTSLSGAPAKPATRLDPARGETAHRWPQFLPDGRHFIFRASSTQSAHDGVIYAGALDSDDRVRLLTADSQALYVAPGYLLFMRGTILFAQPFDASALRVTGEPVAIADQLDRNVGNGRGAFSASNTGVLAYRREGETDLAWFGHDGRRLGAVEPSGRYKNPALSPDERQLAIGRINPESSYTDLWLINLARGGISQFAPSSDKPTWSPDGTRLVFISQAARPRVDTPAPERSFFQRASTGVGSPEELLTDLDAFTSPLGWTPDARTLIFERGRLASTRLDLWLLPIAGDRRPIRWIDSEFSVGQGQLSPNGRWMAYVSDESGKNEVYVRAFPSGAKRRQISVAGGIEPAWRPDGSELLYLAPDQMLMSASITATSAALESSTPVPLFKTRMGTLVNVGYTRNQYLVTHDGRILVNQPPESPSSTPMDVVIDWPARLKK